MAITPVSFDAAMKLVDGRGNIHLLLGTGFSIALRRDIFSYGSLFENADFSGEPEIAQLFDVLETQDFEIAIRHLNDAVRVLRVYQPEQRELLSKLERHASIIKTALVSAIAKHHPNRPTTADRRRAHAFVSARREHLCGNVRVAGALPYSHEGLDGVGELSLLCRPADRLPLQHQVAECFDALFCVGLFPPAIEQIKRSISVEAHYQMDRPVASSGADGVVARAVDGKLVVRRHRGRGLEELGAEVVAGLRRWPPLVRTRSQAAWCA
jgi:hypothetical protein